MISTVKICGLSSAATLEAALLAGADMVGLVFFAKSPRFVSLDQAAALAAIVAAAAPDMLQLHGRETPARVTAIRRAYRRPVMKALGVSARSDFARAHDYEDVADWLLIDAKPPKDASRPGGNGRPFDWRLARDFAPKLPWLLSGGLDAGNVGEAIALSGASGVDVSSGVESAPGVKDEGQIAAFAAAARAAFAHAQERSPA